MYRDRTVGVVVAAYNEDCHVGRVLGGMPELVDRVYVVDDGSTDCTAEIVDNFALRDGRVRLLSHGRNEGVGAAIVTGYKRCVADGLDIAVVMAGDNQMDPAELPRLLGPIVEGWADYSKGDRMSRPEHRAAMPLWRRFGNNVLCSLTRIAVGDRRIMDPQNGYTAASRELLLTLPLDQLYPQYGYCNQMLAWVVGYKRRWVEVPMPARYLGEHSKIRYRSYIPKVSWLLLRLFVWRISRSGLPKERRALSHCVVASECMRHQAIDE